VFNSNHTGAVAEAAIAFAAIQAGLEVFKPLSEHSRADLVFEIGSRLYRVQCKSASKMGEVLGSDSSAVDTPPVPGTCEPATRSTKSTS
jgi:hypothetical protein